MLLEFNETIIAIASTNVIDTVNPLELGIGTKTIVYKKEHLWNCYRIMLGHTLFPKHHNESSLRSIATSGLFAKYSFFNYYLFQSMQFQSMVMRFENGLTIVSKKTFFQNGILKPKNGRLEKAILWLKNLFDFYLLYLLYLFISLSSKINFKFKNHHLYLILM